MIWLLNKYPLLYPKPKYIWANIRVLHETAKAILVLYKDTKIWIPKSRIRKIKLRKDYFWIYARESNLNS